MLTLNRRYPREAIRLPLWKLVYSAVRADLPGLLARGLTSLNLGIF